MSKCLVFSVLAGSLCGILFGFDIGVISGIAPELRAHLALADSALGMAISAALLGTIAGSACAGYLADALERRRTLQLTALVYLLAMLAASLVNHLFEFVAFRFVCGMAIGVLSVVAPMYLAEISPAHLRGRIVGGFQFCVGAGVVLAYSVCYLLSLCCHADAAWRYALATGMASALLCLFMLALALPSPRWLAMRERNEELLRAFERLGVQNAVKERSALLASIQHFGPTGEAHLLSRRYLRPVLLAASLAIFNQLTGVNVILYYILDVFADLGAGRLNGHKDAVLVSILSMVVTGAALAIIDKVGRKVLLAGGAAGMATCLTLLALLRHLQLPAISVVVLVIFYNTFFGLSQGAVIWVYLSEIFPLPVRARGQSMGSTVHWVASAAVVGGFPLMVRSLGDGVFLFFAACMVVQLVVVAWCYPETRQASLESLAVSIGS